VDVLTLLPAVNATLNGASTLCLVTGYYFIRNRRISAHRACMLAAFGFSTLFLACYLYYHAHVGSRPFLGAGWVRPVYFTILISHIILAAAILPLALVTLWRALRGQFQRHRAIARWTLPIWLYVSITGVIVYWMLYHLWPSA
jgi:putative membrane protein